MALAIDGDILQDAYPASLNPESELYLILKIGGGLAVNGLPSCHLTPSRSRNVSWALSSSHDHSLARSGTMDCRPLCDTSC